jgi:hypothetical protein
MVTSSVPKKIKGLRYFNRATYYAFESKVFGAHIAIPPGTQVTFHLV